MIKLSPMDKSHGLPPGGTSEKTTASLLESSCPQPNPNLMSVRQTQTELQPTKELAPSLPSVDVEETKARLRPRQRKAGEEMQETKGRG